MIVILNLYKKKQNWQRAVLFLMEDFDRRKIINQLQIQGIPCIVDVRAFRSLGYLLSNSVSLLNHNLFFELICSKMYLYLSDHQVFYMF